jgi:hypothetical protein
MPRKKRQNAKTKIKLLGTDEVWHPHRGGRPGNRNAWKTGEHNARMRALRRDIRAFLAGVDERVARVERRAASGDAPEICRDLSRSAGP